VTLNFFLREASGRAEFADPPAEGVDQELIWHTDQNYTYCMQRSTDNKYRPRGLAVESDAEGGDGERVCCLADFAVKCALCRWRASMRVGQRGPLRSFGAGRISGNPDFMGVWSGFGGPKSGPFGAKWAALDRFWDKNG